MTLSTSTGAAVLKPEDVAALLVQPVQRAAVALDPRVSTVLFTDANEMRLPIVVADPTAGWVAEGAEISVSDADLTEVNVVPKKVAGLQVISSELANDSSPAAAEVVGAGLARDIGTRVDQAFFNATSPTGAPAGLGTLAGVSTASYANGGPADLDWAAEAISKAEQVGAAITSFVTDPTTALALGVLKTDSGTSNQPLLGQDPTRATGRVALGVPILTSPAVETGVIWALPAARVTTVIRQDSQVETSSDAFFSSDRLAVRAIMRIAFGFGHPAAIVKINEAEA